MHLSNSDSMDLAPTHAFGFHGPIRDNVVLFNHDHNKDEAIFPVGTHLVSFNTQENRMQFFERKQSIHSGTMTALSLSPNQKVVAAAFHGGLGDGAQVEVFQTSNRRRISSLSHRLKITSMCFSGDSKQLVCASDDSIAIWSWEKEKLDYSESIIGTITRLSCPFQPIKSYDLVVSSTGNCHARLWVASSRHRLHNYTIMQNVAKEQKSVFHDHTWLRSRDSDCIRLAVVMEPTRKSADQETSHPTEISVVIYQLSEKDNSTRPNLVLEETVPISLNDNIKIISIAPFRSTSGFFLVGSKGTLLSYEQEQDRNGDMSFTKSHHLRKDSDETFISVQSLNSSEDTVLIVSDTMRAYTCCLGNQEEVKNDEDIFTPYISNEHYGGITEIDCSIEKSFVVSLGGRNNTISICDFELGTCIASHRYHLDEPRTVAIHPSGYQIIVGFKDKMIMYHVLVDRLKSFREMPCKVCHEVKFAPLGQFFAAVLGNGISIFATYQRDKSSSSSFQLLQSFTGHVGIVKDLSWASDNILFTAGVDKNIYGWDIQRGTRIDNMNVLRTFGSCDALVIFSSNKKFEGAACTSDGALHRIDWIGISTAPSELTTLSSQGHSDGVAVSICFNEQKTILYVGTSNGAVRCFNWNTEGETISCFREIFLHDRYPMLKIDSRNPTITGISAASDCLITAGGIDGSLMLSSIRQSKGSKPQVSVPTFHNDDVILITLEDFKQSKDLVTELEQKIISLMNDHEFALHSKDMLWRNEIKELTERTDEIVEAEHLRYDELQKKYEDTIKSHVMDLDKKDETQDLKLQELEEVYEKRLDNEKRRCDEFQSEIQSIQKQFALSFEKQKADHDSKVQSLISNFGSKEKRLKAQINKLEEELKESDKIFNEILDQQEEEYEMELLNLKARSDERLYNETLQNQHMKSAVQNLNSKKNQLGRINDELKSKQVITEDTYRGELTKRKHIQVDLDKERKVVSSLQSQLVLKDKEIKTLQADKKSLVNFKFLFESQIQEIQQEKVPLNERIQSLNEQITRLKCQIEKQSKVISGKDLELDQKDMKLRSQIKNVKTLEQTTRTLKQEFLTLSALFEDDSKKNQKEFKSRLDLAYRKYRLNS